MGKQIQPLRIGIIGLRKWNSNLRIGAIFAVLLVYIFYTQSGVRLLCQEQDLAVTPWIFPGILMLPENLTMIMLLPVLLFCDAPFLDIQSPYSVVRSGRCKWILGQCFYVILTSVVYPLVAYASSLIFSLPNLSFSTKWGHILKMLSTTNSREFYYRYARFLNMNGAVMNAYTPVQAMLLTLLLMILVCSFLGLLILTLNLRLPRAAGLAVASCFVFLDFFSSWFAGIQGPLGTIIYFFSPVSWCNLGNLKMDVEVRPTLSYAIIILLVLNSLLVFLSVMQMRKREIEVLPEI